MCSMSHILQLGEENYSFFPQQQALCLINYTDTQQPVEEEDPMAAMSTEIAFLVRKVNEQVHQYLHKLCGLSRLYLP